MKKQHSRFSPPAREVPLRLKVYTEGRKTEPQYLALLNRQIRQVSMKVSTVHGTPAYLVDQAIKDMKADRVTARRGRGDPFDQYWVVFDWDEHPQVHGVVERARESGLQVALSVPCLEIWFVWHFEDCSREIDGESVQKRAYELLGCSKKELTCDSLAQLLHGTDDAVRRAYELARQHERNGLLADSNPSSGLAGLVEVLRSLRA